MSHFWDLYDVSLGLEIGFPSAALVAGFIYLAEIHGTRSKDESDTKTNRQQAAASSEHRRPVAAVESPTI